MLIKTKELQHIMKKNRLNPQHPNSIKFAWNIVIILVFWIQSFEVCKDYLYELSHDFSHLTIKKTRHCKTSWLTHNCRWSKWENSWNVPANSLKTRFLYFTLFSNFHCNKKIKAQQILCQLKDNLCIKGSKKQTLGKRMKLGLALQWQKSLNIIWIIIPSS